MSKVMKFDNYEMHIRNKKITMDTLLSHYDFVKIEGYCKACPNYGKIWSCPPYDFSAYEYLKKFSSVTLYSGEIIYDLSTLSDDEIINQRHLIYDLGRKEFRKFLMTIEGHYDKSQALIAGHCFLCEECTRVNGKKCIKPKMIRYSLEGMGIEVGTLLKEVLDQALQWDSETTDRLITVGAVLNK